MSEKYSIERAFASPKGELIVCDGDNNQYYVLRDHGHHEEYACAAEAPLVPFKHGYDDDYHRTQDQFHVPKDVINVLTDGQEIFTEDELRNISTLLSTVILYRRLFRLSYQELDVDESSEVSELIHSTKNKLELLVTDKSADDVLNIVTTAYRETLIRILKKNEKARSKWVSQILEDESFLDVNSKFLRSDSVDTQITEILRYLDEKKFFEQEL